MASFYEHGVLVVAFYPEVFFLRKTNIDDSVAKGRGFLTFQWHLFPFAPQFISFTPQLLEGRNSQCR